MQEATRQRLEQHGWAVGDIAEFLDLTPEQVAYIDLKLALSDALRTLRTASGVTQAGLARRMRSSQSRVAKMEAGDPTVSIDLLVRALLALGANRQTVADALVAESPAA